MPQLLGLLTLFLFLGLWGACRSESQDLQGKSKAVGFMDLQPHQHQWCTINSDCSPTESCNERGYCEIDLEKTSFGDFLFHYMFSLLSCVLLCIACCLFVRLKRASEDESASPRIKIDIRFPLAKKKI